VSDQTVSLLGHCLGDRFDDRKFNIGDSSYGLQPRQIGCDGACGDPRVQDRGYHFLEVIGRGTTFPWASIISRTASLFEVHMATFLAVRSAPWVRHELSPYPTHDPETHIRCEHLVAAWTFRHCGEERPDSGLRCCLGHAHRGIVSSNETPRGVFDHDAPCQWLTGPEKRATSLDWEMKPCWLGRSVFGDGRTALWAATVLVR
jgi:hypothetical protein